MSQHVDVRHLQTRLNVPAVSACILLTKAAQRRASALIDVVRSQLVLQSVAMNGQHAECGPPSRAGVAYILAISSLPRKYWLVREIGHSRSFLSYRLSNQLEQTQDRQ